MKIVIQSTKYNTSAEQFIQLLVVTMCVDVKTIYIYF